MRLNCFRIVCRLFCRILETADAEIIFLDRRGPFRNIGEMRRYFFQIRNHFDVNDSRD